VTSGRDLISERLDLRVDGVDLGIAAVHRDGDLPPVVFLHGFGSTKEDCVDFAHLPASARPGFLAYDAPGCGETSCTDLSGISVPFLVAAAEAILDRLDIDRFHLVGHSMGGLTALLLADRHPDRVLSLVDIEGNLAPEDCFLSRQILTHPADDPDSFLDDFVEPPADPHTGPAPSTRPASATRSAPAPCGASSSRWSTCPITATS